MEGRGMYYQYPGYYKIGRNNNLDSMKSEIRVVGEGRITVQPDVATITLGVETENVELQKAQSENALIISEVIQALTNMGITKENIQTMNFTIFPIYDFVDGQQSFRGYRVEHMLRVTVDDISKVGMLVDAAVQAGANRFSNISFSVSNPTKFYREALEMAVNDATEKAQVIATSLNLTLNSTPVKIIEEKTRLEGPIPFMESQMVKSATTEIEPGKQEIKALVTAIFHAR